MTDIACGVATQGGDLTDALRGSTDYTWFSRGRAVAMDVAAGMAFLHERRVLHCDFKSKNIMITKVQYVPPLQPALGAPPPCSAADFLPLRPRNQPLDCLPSHSRNWSVRLVACISACSGLNETTVCFRTLEAEKINASGPGAAMQDGKAKISDVGLSRLMVSGAGRHQNPDAEVRLTGAAAAQSALP